MWGKEEVVREWFRKGITTLEISKRVYPFAYSFVPAEVVEIFRNYYGPTNRALTALEGAAQQALRHDLEHLWTEWNQAKDGTTRYGSEYLEIIAIRA